MKKHNNLNGLNGRCGWICRRLNDISGAVSSIPFVGKIAGGYLAQIQIFVEELDGLFSSKGKATEEPTAYEEVILNQFSTKFNGFIRNMVIALDQAFVGQPNIAIVNRELAKICVVVEYFFANEKEGLSDNAVIIRHQLIQQALAPIRQSIEFQLGAINGLPIKVVANQNDFNALFKNSVANQQYLCKQYSVSGNNNALPGNNNTLPGNNNALPGNNNTLPGTNNTTVTDPENKEKSIFTFQNLVLSVSLIATIIGLSKSKK